MALGLQVLVLLLCMAIYVLSVYGFNTTCLPDPHGSEICQLCGNGELEGTEECDDANVSSNDGCSSLCTIEEGFTCYQRSGVSQCSNCGNGIVEPPETCDDMNSFDLDGCDSNCRIETGFHCSYPHGSETLTYLINPNQAYFPATAWAMKYQTSYLPQIIVCPLNRSIEFHLTEFNLTGANVDGKLLLCVSIFRHACRRF
jgi:cysteine-rich repeat protein